MLGFSRRGQPLIVFAMLLSGWVSARAMMWDSPLSPQISDTFSPHAEMQFKRFDQVLSYLANRSPQLAEKPNRSNYNLTHTERLATPAVDAPQSARPISLKPTDEGAYSTTGPTYSTSPAGFAPSPAGGQFILPPQAPIRLPPGPQKSTNSKQISHLAGGHTMLLMSALAQMGNPFELLKLQPTNGVSEPSHSADRKGINSDQIAKSRRWSMDSWILWRRDSGGQLAGGLLPPSYGASQAGAVLRYNLKQDADHKPTLYFRTSSALNGSGEQEAALGLSVRPVSHIPLLAAGEARVSQGPGGRIIRPAAFVITEFPPLRLPHGLRGEIYGQAGYVGGAYATGFVDGQMRIDKHLLTLEKADIRIGSGIWGGAQKGAARLDAGPTLAVSRTLKGKASVRLGADWRFRLSGKAAPGSGPAVTLSAGF